MLAGIALIPDDEATQAVIDAADTARPYLARDSPVLTSDGNRVHCTVFQFPAVSGTPWGSLLETLRTAASGPLHARISRVTLQPPNWIFADLAIEPWTTRIAEVMTVACQPYIARQHLKPEPELASYPLAEADSYRTFGYRYAGRLWRPHLTIGTVDQDTPVGLGPIEEATRSLIDRRVTFRVTFRVATAYIAGLYGAHATMCCETLLERSTEASTQLPSEHRSRG